MCQGSCAGHPAKQTISLPSWSSNPVERKTIYYSGTQNNTKGIQTVISEKVDEITLDKVTKENLCFSLFRLP